MISLPSALMRQFEEHGPIDGPSVPTNAPYVLVTDLNRSESGCRRSPLALPTQPSINNTADALNGFSRRSPPCRARHGFTQMRRASGRKIASRHLPPGSGDVGLHEAAGPVHEVPERLVVHPRGHRAAPEARGRAAVGVDRRSAAKGVTDSAPGQPSRVADALAV